MFKTFTNFEFAIIVSVIPAAFVYLWTLIAGDLSNFAESRKKLYSYKAKDMVNCYQSYTGNTNGDVKKVG